jgi:hypothetical protein
MISRFRLEVREPIRLRCEISLRASLFGAHVSDGPTGDVEAGEVYSTVRVASSEVISITASRNSGEQTSFF